MDVGSVREASSLTYDIYIIGNILYNCCVTRRACVRVPYSCVCGGGGGYFASEFLAGRDMVTHCSHTKVDCGAQ
jgi:MoaA/NifB/PqqE/SkfB family radical SAM enzyme